MDNLRPKLFFAFYHISINYLSPNEKLKRFSNHFKLYLDMQLKQLLVIY